MVRDGGTLLLANVSYGVIGAGLMAVLGVVDRRRSTWHRLPAAYLLGVAAVVVPASYLALGGLGIGWTGLAVAAVVLGAAGWLRATRSPSAKEPARAVVGGWERRWEPVVAAALLVVAVVLVVQMGRAMAVRPLLESDGWSVWGLKAGVLYELPGSAASVLRQGWYGPPSYPLGMPVLEAIGLRAIGRWDGNLIDLQLLGLALGLVGACWALGRSHARPAVTGLAVLGILSAPQFLPQLWTNLADIPLALLMAAALTAGARWLTARGADRWPLLLLVAFLGLAGLLKNEGLLFVAAVVVALLATAVALGRPALRDALGAAAAVGALVLPWRVYAAANGIETSDYKLSDVVDIDYLREHAFRVGPAASELVSQITDPGSWGPLPVAVGLSLAAAFAGGRVLLASFVTVSLLLAFGGLVLIYWISVLPLENNLSGSSHRTVDTLVIGGTAVVPLLLGSVRRRGDPESPDGADAR